MLQIHHLKSVSTHSFRGISWYFQVLSNFLLVLSSHQFLIETLRIFSEKVELLWTKYKFTNSENRIIPKRNWLLS